MIYLPQIDTAGFEVLVMVNPSRLWRICGASIMTPFAKFDMEVIHGLGPLLLFSGRIRPRHLSTEEASSIGLHGWDPFEDLCR